MNEHFYNETIQRLVLNFTTNLPTQSYFFKLFTCVTTAAAQSNLGKKATLAFANVIH